MLGRGMCNKGLDTENSGCLRKRRGFIVTEIYRGFCRSLQAVIVTTQWTNFCVPNMCKLISTVSTQSLCYEDQALMLFGEIIQGYFENYLRHKITVFLCSSKCYTK